MSVEKVKISDQGRKALSDEVLVERARRYAQSEELVTKQVEREEFLAFELSGEHYLLEARLVEEVMTPSRISQLPRKKDCLSGIMNVRGNLVLILDLSIILDLKAREATPDQRVILVKNGAEMTGITVDRVLRYEELDTSLSQSPMATIEASSDALVKGLFRMNEKSWAWLNTERILKVMMLKMNSD